MPPDTDMPAVALRVMHDSKWSCGAKWIPWHDAHVRGLLGFFFLTFTRAVRADEPHMCCRSTDIDNVSNFAADLLILLLLSG